jgi:hypothetical protein
MTTCDHCGHEWHGLPCSHDAVTRQGWHLRRESCDCLSAYAAADWPVQAEAG